MIQHNKPTIGEKEYKAANKVLASGYIAQGKEVKKFENEFCDFLGLPEGHAVALSSGTSALYLAVWCLDGINKKIAFPSYVCSSLRNAVAMAQSREVLIDNDIESPNISLSNLEKINANIAIIPHMFGIPNKINGIKNMDVIEDCAQSLGASIGGIKTGLLGKAGIFSLYATKIITSGGQGGFFVSKDKYLADDVRDYREFDSRRDNKKRFNFQMTDLQASIGRAQLSQLNFFLNRRRQIFSMYKDAGLDLLESKNLNIDSIYYRAVIKVKNPFEVKEKLFKNKIKSIIPIEDWELLDRGPDFKNAYKLTQETLSLPIYPSLTDIEVIKVINNLQDSIR
jgi:perosamine synthetase